ncbi:MAG: ABC-ATPase domain-containing protein [Cyanobacteria bacterium J06554_11]
MVLQTTGEQLKEQLKNLEGRSYGNYRAIKGDYAFSDFLLSVDYIQGDPFAAPSRICIQLNQTIAKFPTQWITDYVSRVAIADYLTRQVAQVAQSIGKKRGSGKSGNIQIARPSQAILRRTAVWITADVLEARLTVGLPAFGRRIAGKMAAELLCEDIPELVARSLKYTAIDKWALTRHVETLKDTEALRNQLPTRGLVAFIADGACLPRKSGVDERPLTEDADCFIAPSEARVELNTPHSGTVKGLGIRAGVTLIVGGGYHGKSTLLRAIEQGIYSHVPGDGREQVVADPATVKLRAEDGRSIAGVDISPVINHLPRGRDSEHFSTQNASGSTSQAASLIEAAEAGARVLLIDEDTAATNFMIRDRKMQALIAKEKEPITPFVDKVRQLYDDYGISTILVMGGSGDYFSVADTVIAMEGYQPRIVTAQAREIARSAPEQRRAEGGQHFGNLTPRVVLRDSLPSGEGNRRKGNRSLKLKSSRDSLSLGDEKIDLRAIEQIAEAHQVSAIAQAMLYAQQYYFDGRRTLPDILDSVMDDIKRGGLDALRGNDTVNNASGRPFRTGDLAEFRRFELAAAINRLRTVKIATF